MSQLIPFCLTTTSIITEMLIALLKNVIGSYTRLNQCFISPFLGKKSTGGPIATEGPLVDL